MEEKEEQRKLETPEEFKQRWRSIYIIYFTMFFISLGFSIIVTGVWPYLDKLDPTAGKEFMGLVVAANPIGQMLFSPLAGWWSNKMGSIRIPMIACLVMFTVPSAMYSSLELFPDPQKNWMLISRFLTGVGSAGVALCRSYISAATCLSERTKVISMASLAQLLGFIAGPAIQAAVVPIGGTGIWLIPNKLHLDMYTASGWINVIFSVMNIFLFLPNIFKEFNIALIEEQERQKLVNSDEKQEEKKVSYFSAWTLIMGFFVIGFNFMLTETLCSPLVMDQFAWSRDKSLWAVGLLMSAGAVILIAVIVIVPVISRKFSEVKTMIWGGFFLIVIGRTLYFPFNNNPPQMYNVQLKIDLANTCNDFINSRDSFDIAHLNTTLEFAFNKTAITTIEEIRNITFNCGEDLVGCPSNQEWCSYTPAITLTQLIVGQVLSFVGHTFGVTLAQTIFSKMLGSNPQGVWMGLLTGSGSLSRTLGPIYVTFVYKNYGTRWTFGLATLLMAVMFLWMLYFSNNLNPADEVSVEEWDMESPETSKLTKTEES